MAKTTIGNGAAYIAQAQESLKQAGIDPQILDRMIASKSIDAILADSPAVQAYFKAATRGMLAILEPKDLRALRGELPTPDHYQEYFDNQAQQPTPYFNYIPAEDLFNPEAMGKKAGFTQEQTHAYAMLLQGPPETPTAPAALGSGTNPGAASESGAGYGGNTAGKAMSLGGGSHFSPQSKAAGMPGSPPGRFPPPPPSGGMPSGFNLNPHQAIQPYYDYVGSNFQGDWQGGYLNMLGQSQEFMTGIMASGAQQLDEVRKIRAQLVDALANADPKQVMLLNAKMQDLTTTEREITDKMTRAHHYFNERVNLIKGLLDIGGKAEEAIARNMRP
ncbi:MAG TPA: hypothetical protein DF383_12500 [Deltaproteobacteria bacterium]|nr:hypothetical protein [Deltaproteobacteria bacterium]